MTSRRVAYQIGCAALIAIVVNLPSVAYGQFSPGPSEPGNLFETGTLEIDISADEWQPAGAEINLLPGETVTKNIIITNALASTEPVNIFGRFEQTGGNSDVCQNLNLHGTVAGDEVYNDTLTDFNAVAPTLLAPGEQVVWQLDVSLPDDTDISLANQQCQFNFIFVGLQPPDGGFTWRSLLGRSAFAALSSNEVIDSNTVQTGGWGNAVTINNNVPQSESGHWSVEVQSAGESRTAYLTAERTITGDIFTENVLYDYFTYVDCGADGVAIRLSAENASNPTRDPALPNVVSSSGHFTCPNDTIIDWVAISSIGDSEQAMTNRYTFTTRGGGPLGTLRLYQYLDEDVEGVSDDVFFAKGTPATDNLELVTMDGPEVYGVSQSGAFSNTSGLTNASFTGWAADIFNNVKPRLEGAGQNVSMTGVIENLPEYTHPQLGAVRGPADVVSVMAWDVSSNQSTADIVTSLGGLPNAASALRPPLISPPGGRDALGELRPDRPTIVITHGLQGQLTDVEFENLDKNSLFSGFSLEDGKEGAGYLIKNKLGEEVNVIQFVWREGFQGNSLLGYTQARPYADDAGTALAKYLTETLGVSYNQPIHFIGHSLGTVANAHAARLFLELAVNVPRAQVTILDYPHHTGVRSIPTNFFAILLQDLQNNLNFKVDNYYSLDASGFGDQADGRIYNHQNLNNPSDLRDEIFFSETQSVFSANHSGVHQWYRWTMNPEGFNDTDYCDDNNQDRFTPPDGGLFSDDFDESLDPCQEGWYWSLFGQGGWDEFPAVNGDSVSVDSGVTLPLGNPASFGCEYEDGVITCSEQSSPYIVFDIEIPETADYLSFDYNFPNIGDGDYVSVLIDDVPLWTLAAENAINPNELTNSGPIPLNGLNDGASHKLTVSLFGVGEKNAQFTLQNIQTIGTDEHTAQSLKRDVLERLHSLQTGKKDFDKKIVKASRLLEKSLDDTLWVDETHLHAKKGSRVFKWEKEAVQQLHQILNHDDKWQEKPEDHRKKAQHTLSAENRIALEQIISDLLTVDRILATTAADEAQELLLAADPVSRNAVRLNERIDQALEQASEESNRNPKKAINRYGRVWILAQKMNEVLNGREESMDSEEIDFFSEDD